MKNTNHILLVLKGCAMGAADVVPGVSGGTIAFISGIYGELIESIRSFDMEAVKYLFTLKLGKFWGKINGNFLASVIAGIAVSIFSLARLMTYLLENHPIYIWSFFFGLIIASSLLVSKEVTRWRTGSVISMLAGIAAAYLITALSPASTPDTWWFVILSGAVAICAMILPGISGAFILLLLGKYMYIMDAVANLKIGIILLFVIGAAGGIISFSHFLSWLLRNHHNMTIALLTGFMIGSLNKVWPWKQVLSTYTDSHGTEHPLMEANVLPSGYASLTGSDPLFWEAIVMCAAGFLLIWGIEQIGKRMKNTPNAGR